jgi:molybdopterin molybdotransferase
VGQVGRGEAVRALTGAPVPAGADTVVMQEACAVAGEAVTVPAGVKPGINRRRTGEDVREGQALFARGQRLLPQHLGVAAELGLAELPVMARLRVALFSSGDEIQEPGTALAAGGVYDANRYLLKALLAGVPAEVTDLGILPDDPVRVREALAGASEAHDVVLISGGASGGDEDHVVRAVRAMGSLHFWRIRMKPGRPLALGSLGGAAFIGLPGNPVAVLVCFVMLARPMLLALAGGGWTSPRAYPLPAAFAMRRETGRTEMLRARLVRGEDGGLRARRILREGSGILTSLTDADGLIEIGEEVALVKEGDPVPFLSFAELLGGGHGPGPEAMERPGLASGTRPTR